MSTPIILSALDCPKCGAPLDAIENERITVCIYCNVPVTLNWQDHKRPSGFLDVSSLGSNLKSQILESLQLKLSYYHEEWCRFEQEYSHSLARYKEQVERVIGKRDGGTGLASVLDEKKKRLLEPYENDYKSGVTANGIRSNNLALKIDLTIKNCKNLNPGFLNASYASWPDVFANILEFVPSGSSYLHQFEPLIYELSRRNLLVEDLGKIDSFIPLRFLINALPAMITCDLPFAQAAELNNRLMVAGAVGRIAATSLTQRYRVNLKSLIKLPDNRR